MIMKRCVCVYESTRLTWVIYTPRFIISMDTGRVTIPARHLSGWTKFDMRDAPKRRVQRAMEKKNRKIQEVAKRERNKIAGLVNFYFCIIPCEFWVNSLSTAIGRICKKRDKRMEAYKVSRSTLNSVVYYFGL